MSKVLVIGCGGVASVAISKCCQVSDVFTELCIASRTKSKCDALAAKLAPYHPDQNHHRAGRCRRRPAAVRPHQQLQA